MNISFDIMPDLDEGTMRRLAELLPEFLPAQRWFRAKARTIENVGIDDVLSVPSTPFCFLLIRVKYSEGAPDRYVLTTRSDGVEGQIQEALADPQFRNSLLAAIHAESTLQGRAGSLVASHTSAFPSEFDSDLSLASFVSGAEQSNTSIVYGDRLILKLFRKIEPGVNPDLEIGTFLTEHGFQHTPAVLGKLEYQEAGGGDVYAAGIVQQFVQNRGDAWKYTLESLDAFFERVLSREGSAPALVSHHPLQLIGEEMPADARELLGSYGDSARLLGNRTAEMHAALADSADPDFAPVRFTREDGQELHQEMLGQADITFELLRRKRAMLTHDAAESAQMLSKMEHRVTERFSAIRDRPICTLRIRYHGDFHLGQVLYTGSDFMIIDFEGEPARPLSQRRGKTLAMRDVAGMIRSFQYGAYTALAKQQRDHPERSKASALESWAEYWNAWVSGIYLKAYFSAAGKLPFVPADAEERRTLFDAFLLQKALYEVAYELNNRPDWVRIPLRGILSLMS